MRARGRCRISPPRFLAECCKRQLNQGSFVLLYFRLLTFSDLYWVCIFLYCFVCQYQSSDWPWRPPPKWPILCRLGVKLYSNSKLIDKHRDRQTYRWCYSVCSYVCSTGWKFCSRSTCCNTCISAVLSTLHTHSRTFNGPFSGNFKFWCLRVIWGTVVPKSQLPGGNFFAIYILGKKL